VHAAVLAELGGAAAISVHLRADRRHVQDHDVEVLRETVRTRFELAMAAGQEMLRVALTVKPDQVTLLPERREELTTEGGLDVVLNSVQIRPMVKTLSDAGIVVALFVDPELEQVKESHKLGAQVVRVSTEAWAAAADARSREGTLRRFTDAARLARKLGLEVQAGHGLGYANVGPIAAQSEVSEIEIGHAIVARALLVGMERAVREMVEILRAARQGRG
jgi:pyridoxine 5-phosphate synthase